MGNFVANPFDPDVMELKKGGHPALIAVGALFLFLEAMFCIFIFTDAEFRKDMAAMIVTLAMSSIFGLVGIGLMFGRSGMILNRHTKTITKWWGILVPMHRTGYSWIDFDQVIVNREVRRTQKSSYTVFPVRLRNTQLDKKVNVEENTDYLTSRRTAETLAKFIKIPMADSSGDALVVREYTELDETVRDRVRRTGKLTEVPELPKSSKLQQKVDGQDLVIQIPASGFGCLSIFVMIFAIVITLVASGILLVLVMEPGQSNDPLAVQLIVPCILLLPAIFLFLLSSHIASSRVEIRVSPERLMVKKISKFTTNVQEIPTNQLEELTIAESNNPALQGNAALLNIFGEGTILARSDYAVIVLGSGLNKAELKWLLAVIENTVSA